MVIQVSGFDDKVNIPGLVTGTNKPLEEFFISSPFGWGAGGGGPPGAALIETRDLFDREGLI